MVSAAQKVFAIPELLELILLSLGSHDYILHGDLLKGVQQSKELFALHRVNRNFQATIIGSLDLRFRLGISYHPAAYEADFTSQHIISPYMRFQELYLGPFAISGMFTGSIWSENEPIHFHLQTDGVARELRNRPVELLHGVGMRNGNNRRLAGRHHSWRDIKLTAVQVPVTFKIFLRTRSFYPWCSIRAVALRLETVFLRNQWAPRGIYVETFTRLETLGQLHDQLEKIALRNPGEHALREFALQARGKEGIPCLFPISWLVVGALLLWIDADVLRAQTSSIRWAWWIWVGLGAALPLVHDLWSCLTK